MLKIIICEDNINDCEELKQTLSHLLFDREEVTFECYEDGSELVEVMERGGHIWADLIFMDITMPRLDGMKTAHILRRNDVDSAIIFITARKDMVFQGYEVQAYAYLIKPVAVEKLEEILRSYLEKRRKVQGQFFLIKRQKRKEFILLNAIKYLMSDKRKIKAVVEYPCESIEFYMKMQEAEEVLKSAGFFRCHQSYLVNMHHVLYWDGNSIVMKGNEKIPVSRKYREEVNRKIESCSNL